MEIVISKRQEKGNEDNRNSLPKQDEQNEIHIKRENQDQHSKNLLIYQGREIIPLPKHKILFIFSEEKERFIRTEKSTYNTNSTLDKLEKEMGNKFFRANRQTLIGFHSIDKILFDEDQKITVTIKEPINKSIQISKRRNNDFKEWLKNA